MLIVVTVVIVPDLVKNWDGHRSQRSQRCRHCHSNKSRLRRTLSISSSTTSPLSKEVCMQERRSYLRKKFFLPLHCAPRWRRSSGKKLLHTFSLISTFFQGKILLKFLGYQCLGRGHTLGFQLRRSYRRSMCWWCQKAVYKPWHF